MKLFGNDWVKDTLLETLIKEIINCQNQIDLYKKYHDDGSVNHVIVCENSLKDLEYYKKIIEEL